MLLPILKKHIKRNGFMNLATYMELCLSHPGFGYYKTQTAIGELDQDFITSPELSSLFGDILGAWCVDQISQNFDRDKTLYLIELGPGKGTLMKDVLSVISQFYLDLTIEILFFEINPILKKHQSEMMQTHFPDLLFNHIDHLSQLPKGQSLCFSNEFFDALPIRAFQKHDGKFLEQIVALNEKDELCLTLSPTQTGMNISLDLTFKDTKNEAIIEISPFVENIMMQLTYHYEHYPGAVFICDYGYEKPPLKSTLRAIKNHQFMDLFETPGESDLSAFVNFEKLQQLIPYPSTLLTQRDFLKQNGALERLKNTHTTATNLLLDENKMGNIFKVITFSTFEKEQKCPS